MEGYRTALPLVALPYNEVRIKGNFDCGDSEIHGKRRNRDPDRERGITNTSSRIQRNETCPLCNSGKKYKKCCLIFNRKIKNF
jgi:hypothetical protein